MKSPSLLQSKYNQITIGTQSVASSSTSGKHSTSSSLIYIYKKKDDKGERQNKKKIKEKWKTTKKDGKAEEGSKKGRKEKRRRKRRKGKRWKRGEDEWKEFVQEEREEEERRERGREKEKGESGARGALPSTDAFPSTKLGNNITPMKGRLGKNTTPTNRSPTELNQNLQNNPQQRRPDFDASSHTNFSYAPEVSKYKFYSRGATIYKKAETIGNPCKRLKFSINQH